MLQKILAVCFLILLLPVFVILYIIHYFFSPGSFIFIQKRVGKKRKVFWIYKIQTMVEGAQSQRKDLVYLNEADGPVFKIKNDPRFTQFGKFLSHTGLDELPQLLNIIKGDMAFVGPRPLPAVEAKNIPLKYQKRFSLLPGITSLWVIKGAHTLSFDQWMQLDLWYVDHRSIFFDIYISFATIVLMVKVALHYLREQGIRFVVTK